MVAAMMAATCLGSATMWYAETQLRKIDPLQQVSSEIFNFRNFSYACSFLHQGRNCLPREISKKFCSDFNKDDSTELCEINLNPALQLSRLENSRRINKAPGSQSQSLCCQSRLPEIREFGNDCKLKQLFDQHCPYSDQCLPLDESASVCAEGEYLCYCNREMRFPCPARDPTGDDFEPAIAVLAFIILTLKILAPAKSVCVENSNASLLVMFTIGLLFVSGAIDSELGARDKFGVSVYITAPRANENDLRLFVVGFLLLINLDVLYLKLVKHETQNAQHNANDEQTDNFLCDHVHCMHSCVASSYKLRIW